VKEGGGGLRGGEEEMGDRRKEGRTEEEDRGGGGGRGGGEGGWWGREVWKMKGRDAQNGKFIHYKAAIVRGTSGCQNTRVKGGGLEKNRNTKTVEKNWGVGGLGLGKEKKCERGKGHERRKENVGQ